MLNLLLSALLISLSSIDATKILSSPITSVSLGPIILSEKVTPPSSPTIVMVEEAISSIRVLSSEARESVTTVFSSTPSVELLSN